MGCDEVREINERPESREPKVEGKNLITKILKGRLEHETELGKFKDCIIHNDDELYEKISSFIPTWIKDQDNNDVRNTNDDIMTKTYVPNFENEYLIAINGCNITRVENQDGNYLIYHDGKSYSQDTYCAVAVEKLPGDPYFLFAIQKPSFSD